MRRFSGHADVFTEHWVRVSRLTDVNCICIHFNGQSNVADYVACMGAVHTTTPYFAAAEAEAVVVGRK